MIKKDEIKESLTIAQIYSLLEELGGEPQEYGSSLISKTICHNECNCGKHKLYYYDNTKLFHCYTDCSPNTFDIFELVIKSKKINFNEDWSLPQSIAYVAKFFGIEIDYEDNEEHQELLEDWKIFNNYKNKSEQKETSIFDKKYPTKVYDSHILKNLPFLRIKSWEQEGISPNILLSRGIRYYPTQSCIIIPHYNGENQLVGIRQRVLSKEEEQYGKYRPAILAGKMYNHPLGLNLYNFNNSKENIRGIQKAIIFESEKSCLQMASWLGEENDISVACCGSSVSERQIQLLLREGVSEIVIGLDKQFKEVGDKEWLKLTQNFKNIHNKYGNYVQISYLFDKENLLGYKDSPTDKGKEIFLNLFKHRIVI